MTTGARNLGFRFDIGLCFAPVDMQTATNTGKRIALGAERRCTFVLIKAVGTAGDDPVVSFQQHTAYVSGTSSNLSVVTKYYLKDEAVLDNDETWQELTQSVAASITDPGGAGTSAEHQQILVVEIDGDQLDDGYGWVSMNVADVGGNAQLGAAIYIVEPIAGRKPANLPNLLHPGAANA